MIPILYTAGETKFITNGIGRLSDCTKAIVTEERNGIYELEFDMPITGTHFDDITLGRIVGCTHDDNHDIQPFVIYSRSVPDLNGIVTFNAHHISYRLNDVVVMPFTASSVADAMSKIGPNSVNGNPFTFWTDKTTAGTFKVEAPRSIRGMLGGEEGSLLDVYGAGDYEFDRFEVKLYAHRGTDSDVEIRYSKNLTGLSETIDESGSYNAIVPYWADADGHLVTLPEVIIVYSGMTPLTAYLTDHNLIIVRTEDDEPIEVAFTELKAVPYDMSDAFDDMPTASQLRAAAQARFLSSYAWLPDENLTVDFVQLWQTEEFKDYAAAQRVSLCDTVSVYYPAVGIKKVKQKVVKVVYNVLLDRYDSIELGQPQTSLGQAIKSDVLRDVPTTSMMDSAIKYATDLIRGGLGGYVVMTPGPDGHPQEILIMDTPDITTAVNVWRFNQGGLGHSSNGYQGPFSDIALTADGKINASMITAGILNANIIRAGTISDSSGLNYWNLAGGQFVTKRGEIGPFAINDLGLSYRASWADYDSVKVDYTGIETITRVLGSDNVYQIRCCDMRSGEFSILGLYNASVPPANWNDYDQILSVSPTYDSNGEPYTQYRMAGLGRFLVTKGSATYPVAVEAATRISGDFTVTGTKNRAVGTDNYSERLLYCYETPTPLFGDIGEAVIGSDGLCYVDIDDIFSETIANRVEYQVFLQKEGEGDCWVSEKRPRYFVIQGTPNMKVAWELKAKQKGYETMRLEQSENNLDEYGHADETDLLNDYIREQEDLFYGNY